MLPLAGNFVNLTTRGANLVEQADMFFIIYSHFMYLCQILETVLFFSSLVTSVFIKLWRPLNYK